MVYGQLHHIPYTLPADFHPAAPRSNKYIGVCIKIKEGTMVIKMDDENVCVLCKDVAEEMFYSEKLDGWVCEPCYLSDRDYSQGIVRIFKPNDGIVETYEVRELEDDLWIKEVDNILDYNWGYGEFEDGAICPIQFKWVSTDPWRGYYTPKSDEWVELHEDCFLAGSRDAKDLEEFNKSVIVFLWNLGVEFAVITSRTSNVFSAGYDLMVHKSVAEDLDLLFQITSKLAELKYHYRDPVRFTLTALTGKDDFEETP